MPSPPTGPPPGSFGLRIMNRFTALNVFLYRRTGGRIGGAIGNIKPIALVDHVGAKSGTKRTTPLVYTRDGDEVIIVGSQGGLECPGFRGHS
ncbi:MAG: nitroreductase/quinone reductase family protein [Solirubrobacterales bacterium]